MLFPFIPIISVVTMILRTNKRIRIWTYNVRTCEKTLYNLCYQIKEINITRLYYVFSAGVILSNDAQPVTEEAVSSRQFGGSNVKTGGVFGIGGTVSTSTTTEEPKSSYTPGPVVTFANPTPTTDTSMIRGKYLSSILTP